LRNTGRFFACIFLAGAVLVSLVALGRDGAIGRERLLRSILPQLGIALLFQLSSVHPRLQLMQPGIFLVLTPIHCWMAMTPSMP
jgi:hypothetical protein